MSPAEQGRPVQIPATLDAKFTQLISRYPFKRSALVPMMMYAQDYYGFVGDDVLAEIARRLDLNMTQVTETMAYYSMLRRKPAANGSAPLDTRLLYYTYSISGVTYETAQDISDMEERACLGHAVAGQAASVKYDPSNPSNSILLADDWSGLH